MDARTAALRRLTERVVVANNARAPVQICGGGTKAFYGGVPRGEVLPTQELCGITSYEPTELVVTALAGTALAELEAALAACGQCLPFEPPRFAPGGTVGGMVAAGLAGPARPSVGGVRDHLLGVSVLNGAGETLTFGGQVMKNVAGYDVSRVMSGSMGILGLICEVSLKVMPVPAATATLSFDMDQATALRELNRWAAQPLPISASSWHRDQLRVRLSGAKAAVRSVQQRLGGLELEPQAAGEWWRELRDQQHVFFDLGDELMRGEALWRMSVADTPPPLLLAGEQFIEWGGALRWLRSSVPSAEVRAAAAAAGGHATLFRAADKACGAFAAPTPPVLAIHRRLKQSFDPAGIFNPGRLYAEL
jgi:FAD/FMN-containing dehydrogenase